MLEFKGKKIMVGIVVVHVYSIAPMISYLCSHLLQSSLIPRPHTPW